IVTAAPTEVLNPGLYDSLKAALSVPFTTALHACVAALRVYSAPRVLLLTPFDARLNELIVQHLQKVGVTAIEIGRGHVCTPVTPRSPPFPTRRSSDLLRVYSAPRVLLLTPFDARLNELIVQHLQKVGVTAI